MVSDAKWIDIDGDKDEDLVIVGEFSPIQIFINEDGRFSKLENKVLNNTIVKYLTHVCFPIASTI